MKRFIVLVFLMVWITSSETSAVTFQSSFMHTYNGIMQATYSGFFSLNEYTLTKYFMRSYGDPASMSDNNFMRDSAGWMTINNDSTDLGEYQHLGYTVDNVKLTNDRWFSTPSHLGTQFNKDYSGVKWHDIFHIQGVNINLEKYWRDYQEKNIDMLRYILMAPLFDSDHPTKGERPTGFTLPKLLPNDQWRTKAYLLSEPTQYEDGALYLRYTQNGLDNYNTIQIPALPRVECEMTAKADKSAIERGTTSDVVITVNTTDSYALIYHEKKTAAISQRTYWASAGNIMPDTPGAHSISGTYSILVPNVAPNTTINVKATVFSQEVANLGQLAEDTKSTTIFIGETVPAAGDAPNISGNQVDASAGAVLRAEPRDHETFDVAKGIPATESLYAQINGKEYLIRQSFRNMTGSIPYTVSVSHPVQPVASPPPNEPGWPPPSTNPPGNTEPPVSPEPAPTQYASTTVQVSRSYSFWEIDTLEVYALGSATLRNTVLSGGAVTLLPTAAYHAPVVDMVHRMDDLLTYHLQTGPADRNTSASSWKESEIRSAAESVIPSLVVRNDRLIINGRTLLSDAQAAGSGSVPVSVTPEMISRDALYKPGLIIPATVSNAKYITSGTIRYVRVPGAVVNGSNQASMDLPIRESDMNAVSVHTPVLLDAALISDDAHNQMPVKSANNGSVVLGRPFVLRLTNTGDHLVYPGYGNREYDEYIRETQIRSSFDVYYGNLYSGKYLQAGVWMSLEELGVPHDAERLELKVPSWVQPGEHKIELRTIAVNDPFGGSQAVNANAQLTSDRQELSGENGLSGRLERATSANLQQSIHAASVTIPVRVVGRIYDFQITDIEDPMWETFFRVGKGKLEGTGNRFFTGIRNINGGPDSVRSNILPILPGKNTQPGFQDHAVKLGYGVRFELKTVGDYFHRNDTVRIHPSFHYLDKNGQNRQEVDLYYAVQGKPLVKVAGAQDATVWKGKVDFSYRNLSKTEWEAAGTAGWNINGVTDGFSTESAFVQAFIQSAQKGTDMFRTWRILLGESVRTFRGPAVAGTSSNVSIYSSNTSAPVLSLPESVDATLAYASMQKWYGEYRLPPDTLIVPKDTDLSKIPRISPQNPIFLKEGYLMVNFRAMEVIDHGDFTSPVLLYGGSDSDTQCTGKPASFAAAAPALMDAGNGWYLEGYSDNQNGWDIREGDAVAFYANRRSTDDFLGLGTH